jgi:hypothetical protein
MFTITVGMVPTAGAAVAEVVEEEDDDEDEEEVVAVFEDLDSLV